MYIVYVLFQSPFLKAAIKIKCSQYYKIPKNMYLFEIVPEFDIIYIWTCISGAANIAKVYVKGAANNEYMVCVLFRVLWEALENETSLKLKDWKAWKVKHVQHQWKNHFTLLF